MAKEIMVKQIISFLKNIKSFYKFYVDYEYNGNDCRFIIENYQDVLSNRTQTMSKPTYYANAVIDELDKWYEEAWKSTYKYPPMEKNT